MDEDSEEFEDTLDHVLFPQQSRSDAEVSSNFRNNKLVIIKYKPTNVIRYNFFTNG